MRELTGVIVLCVAVMIPIVIITIVVLFGNPGRKGRIRSMTAQCPGLVLSVKTHGIDTPWRIRVRYEVDGIAYEVVESLALKSSVIKAGPIPIGQRKTPVMGLVREGDTVTVIYNPDKPSKSHIQHNDGWINN
ncbi:DUF3592 domain-containing protein [Bifidobacterium eulemuris]|uniref:DUF3592 domain-containing protein n=1 Tax=Bifidobacterium eulemuris TaxID=1765219 RepID=A0A261G7F1_9BIFI|nr:DUF3592 domain-containing protein [Bifidobacterium eulemuris]OZG67349.1 hypothetical protein BEUL_1440 [Bifidobacterium eulemuris]QOL32927.1 DUF3592 domain-containing protein [Bifidobacterium eulemuris]